MISTDVSIDSYHADRGFCSHSRLLDFAKGGPRLYYKRHVTGELARDETDALRFGIAFETLVQRPAQFEREYSVGPKGDGRVAAVKQFKAACLASGKGYVTGDEFAIMNEMAASLHESHWTEQVLPQCQQQVTLRGELYGVPFQARPDWVLLDKFMPLVVDLKSTRDWNMLALPPFRGVTTYGYHTQLALVRALLEQNGYPGAQCYLYVCEKEEPYRSGPVRLPDTALAIADRYLEQQITQLKRCLDADHWPRASDDVIDVVLPKWVANDAGLDLDMPDAAE